MLTFPTLHARQLCAAAVHVAEQALPAIDLTTHAATHPRLGAVDHISCHPVGADANLEHAAQLALDIGRRLSQPPSSLPVYLYGAASSTNQRLADIRRRLGEHAVPCNIHTIRFAVKCLLLPNTHVGGEPRTRSYLLHVCRPLELHQAHVPAFECQLHTDHQHMVLVHAQHYKYIAAIHCQSSLFPSCARMPLLHSGYFRGTQATKQTWHGALPAHDLLSRPPEFGPHEAKPSAGVLTLGAVPWLVNFNVPLHTQDMTLAKGIAKAISDRGGGLAHVEVSSVIIRSLCGDGSMCMF
eukprot:jgi/Chrzof1/10676/Cz05g08080.t1